MPISTRASRLLYWETTVKKILAAYLQLDSACTSANHAGTLCPEGPLYEATWRAFSAMLSLIDQDEWITWFIYENDCGKKAMSAKGPLDRILRPVKTPRHLARLIVQSETHRTS